MPKDNAYGEDYGSGRMRIGFARGNKVLQTAQGEIINSKILSGGLLLSDQGTLRKFGTKSKSSEGPAWSNEFHLYTLTWKPGIIALCAIKF